MPRWIGTLDMPETVPPPFCQGPDWRPYRGTCGACGGPLPPRHGWFCSKTCDKRHNDQHDWNCARAATLKRDGNRCVECGGVASEVHHIVPRNGLGYRRGCHHHLDNLISLCAGCHLVKHHPDYRTRLAEVAR